MELHDHLSVLTLQAGPGVLDDATALRSALATYAAANPGSAQDVELIVAAAERGATRSLVASIDGGADAAVSVVDLGSRLAAGLGAPVGAVQWACAALGYAAGRVSDADVRRFRAGDNRIVPPPTAGSFSPPTIGPGSQRPGFEQAYAGGPGRQPDYQQPAPAERSNRTVLIVAGVVAAVVLIAGGLVLVLTGGDDTSDQVAGGDTSSQPTSGGESGGESGGGSDSASGTPTSPIATSDTTTTPTTSTAAGPLVSRAASTAFINALNSFSPKFSAAGDLMSEGRINHEFEKTLQGASQMRDAVYDLDAEVRLIDLSGIQTSVNVMLENDREMVRLLDQIQRTDNSRKAVRKVGELPIEDFTGAFQDVAAEIDANVG